MVGDEERNVCSAGHESFYGSPFPILFLAKIAGFETSSRPYLLTCGGPCHLDVISFDSP